MHELNIATEILRAVNSEAARANLLRVDEIGLRIGALSGVDPDALRFALEASTIDTPLAGVRVDIECLPVRATCRACQGTIEVTDYMFICPHCGSGDLVVTQGEELQLARITGQDQA